jgi:hypothetical protein
LLKLQPYVQSSVVQRPCPKLSLKYFRPYPVVEKIGTVAYKLQLPAGSQVHPVFHVAQLKQFTTNHALVFSKLPSIPLLDLHDLVPEEILDRWLSKKGNQAVTQVLIKWSSLPTSFATWVDYNVVKQRYPGAPAWGQSSS